jgi:hypothetical protein
MPYPMELQASSTIDFKSDEDQDYLKKCGKHLKDLEIRLTYKVFF